MIILDTDVLSVVQRGDSPEYERLAARLDTADEEVTATIISIEEQMRGWLAFIAHGQVLVAAGEGLLKVAPTSR